MDWTALITQARRRAQEIDALHAATLDETERRLRELSEDPDPRETLRVAFELLDALRCLTAARRQDADRATAMLERMLRELSQARGMSEEGT